MILRHQWIQCLCLISLVPLTLASDKFRTPPTFDAENILQVQTLRGKTVDLKCRIHNIGDRTISWIRKNDYHLLVVGHFTYTSDPRISTILSDINGVKESTLRIAESSTDDSGTYECQISTAPPIAQKYKLTVLGPPKFLNSSTEITVEVGQTASIHCPVKDLGDHIVSWIRKRDTHVLTSNNIIYTTDERFKAERELHEEDGRDGWSITLTNSKVQDTGIYECHISASPQPLIKYFKLNVEVAKAVILEGPELVVDQGQNLTITCQIPVPLSNPDPSIVQWIRKSTSDDSVTIITPESRPGAVLAQSNSRASLEIPDVSLVDAGRYICIPSPVFQPTSAMIIVKSNNEKI